MNMKKIFRQSLVLAAFAAMVSFSTHVATAQDADRNEQRRQDQLKRYRELMDIKSDADWRDKIEPLVVKVQEAQRVAGSTRGFAGFGGFGGRGGAAGGGRGGNGGGNGGGNRAGQASPEFEALQKAITDKEPVEDVKEKLAKYRELRKTRDAAVEKAQDELRKALSPRQEAGAVVAGLLK
jgi:hypothetical protein